MSDDLLERLKRLGVTRGARDLKPAHKPQSDGSGRGWRRPFGSSPDASLARLLPGGRIEDTPLGSCFVLDHVYSLSYQHGRGDLASLLDCRPDIPAMFLGDSRLADLDYRDFLFLDTETTGLAGAGTLAFMVGVAYFEQNSTGEALVVRQYFLRDHGDEAAMLLLLEELASERKGLITFNGRGFDIPLLSARYLMNRRATRLDSLPHLDLLLPSRRLWRRRIGSVALGNLERELLGVRRTEDDIPGWLIPSVYNNFVRSGDARELSRVFYHNEIDMLSMVTLTTEISHLLETPGNGAHALDAYSVGKWQADLGLSEVAEATLRQSLTAELPLDVYHQILQALGLLLKRANRHEEAVPLWQQWAATSLDDISGFVELAKYYEWQTKDLNEALTWTQRALDLTTHWSTGESAVVRPELEYRLERLRRKLAG
jgi:uncharacterized protein YprB with RNaseH-like and TPR domain